MRGSVRHKTHNILIVCESTIDFIFVLLFVGKMNKLDDGKDTFVQKSLKEAQWPEGDSNLEATSVQVTSMILLANEKRKRLKMS